MKKWIWIISALAVSQNIFLGLEMDVNSVLMATLFSAAVGIFFGLYPANRAANLEPVEVLRTDKIP